MAIQKAVKIKTQGRGIYDITDQVAQCVSQSVNAGLCHVFCQHTSASLILCENYDGDVKIDIETFFLNLVKDGDPRFKHTIEGPDDMAAHIRTLLTQSSLTIPIVDAQLGLGTWQGVCLYEHRLHSHDRQIVITITE
ncbi:MAG: secondary thiamine-phosphate synthase enzyme YjbQ [Gammaproteobacteria bacterium]